MDLKKLINSHKLYKLNIDFNKISINFNKINIEFYKNYINEILRSSKVTKSDHFPGPPKTGSGQAFTWGPKNDQFLTNLIKQTSKYKKYYNNIKIKCNLLLKL